MIDIKKIRLKLGYYNQEEFADKLGVSRSYYSRLENNRKPLSEKIKYMLVNTFGISKDYLDGKIKEPFPKISQEENDKLMYDKNFISMVSSVVSSRIIKEKEKNPPAPSNYEKLNLKQKKVIDKMIDMLLENDKNLDK